MRVLQVSKFYPPVLGGIETVAWELCEGLSASGVDVEVLCSDQRLPGRTDRFAAGYSVTRAGSIGVLQSTSIAPSILWHLARRGRCADVVHMHMPDPMAAMALRMSGLNLPLVVHWHSDVVRQRRALRLYEPLQRWVLRRADAVIATSLPYAQASAPLHPWRSKVEVVPIGISDNATSADDDQVRDIRRRYHDRRIVLSIGRMTYYKGFEVLIEAAANLPDDCAVVIGGGGELLDHYRSLVRRRGLAGRVHLVGQIADDELPSYFQACDIFCMPSTLRAEAYGVAILEAMVMGKPIVSSDIPGSGVPWVNVDGETGLGAPPGDSAALSAALNRLLSDRELRLRLGRQARRRYDDEFRADLMTQRTLNLYRRLVPVTSE